MIKELSQPRFYFELSLITVLYVASPNAAYGDTDEQRIGISTKVNSEETIGTRANLSYNFSKTDGFRSELGLVAGHKRYSPAPQINGYEYGVFWKYLMPRLLADHAFFTQISIINLFLPEKHSSKSSLSSLNVEIGVSANWHDIFFEVGVALRHFHNIAQTVHVGEDKIEKNPLLYPTMGIGVYF